MHDISDTVTLHKLWGAKEAIYKLLGGGEVDSHNDIIINDKDIHQGHLASQPALNVHLEHFTIENQMIVLAIE